MQDPTVSAQATLAYLERANLLIIPLDDERRWYRYHHLFADLLRQRLQQSSAATPEEATRQVQTLHARASAWYEGHGLTIEAFQHAVAAQDVERADHLLEGNGMPRHFRGVLTVLLGWLESLPIEILNSRPSLWVRHASMLVVSGQTTGVEEKLQAAEAALRDAALDEKTRDLIGRIAAIRATLALTRYQIDAMLTQSRRALEYLPPDNLMSRVTANWTAGFAYTLQGNRVAARQAYTEAIALSRAFGDTFTTILSVSGLGAIQEMDNQLSQAAETYRHVLQLVGEQPLQIICEAQLGLARILYEWNDLDGAWQHGQQSSKLARQYDERVIDRYIACEVFLARLHLALGDVEGAATLLAQTNQAARQHNFVHRFPEVAAMQVLILLKQEQLTAAAHIAQSHPLPFIQARVHLAQGDASAALALLSPLRQQAESKGWQDERLKVMLLQALALQQRGEKQQALQLLGEALALAEPAGFVRLFVDEGLPMARLLAAVAAQGIMPDYIKKLLTVWQGEARRQNNDSPALPAPAQALIEPLSQRELEVLHLIVQGLSNQQISTRLFLALSTVKGHNRKIFDKLGVQRRTEAAAGARELGLL